MIVLEVINVWGDLFGGVIVFIFYGWLFVKMLWVVEDSWRVGFG